MLNGIITKFNQYVFYCVRYTLYAIINRNEDQNVSKYYNGTIHLQKNLKLNVSFLTVESEEVSSEVSSAVSSVSEVSSELLFPPPPLGVATQAAKRNGKM